MPQSIERRIIPNTIFFIPGQDSQYPGMGNKIQEEFSAARRIYARADNFYQRRTGKKNFITSLSLEGTPEQQMQHAQILLTTQACATIFAVREAFGNVYPEYAAGNSAGEPAAAFAAGALRGTKAIGIAYERENTMNGIAGDKGRMAAIAGLGREAIDKLSKQFGVDLATTFPAKEFVIISGPIHAIEEAITAAKESGARLAKQLKIPLASHSLMMSDAAKVFEGIISHYNFHQPISKFIMNAAGEIAHTSEEIKKNLSLSLVKPVKLDKMFQLFIHAGGKYMIDVGPGDSISKSVQRGNLPIESVTLDSPQGMQQLAKLLGK